MAPTHEPTLTDLSMHGTPPVGLNGRLLSIGLDDAARTKPGGRPAAEGVVHAIHLHHGRALSYRSGRVITDSVAQRLGLEPTRGPRITGPDVIADAIVVLGSSILALGDGSLAYELTSDLDTLRRVDLAGQSRGVAATVKRDPMTGDLHLLAMEPTGEQAHVVVSARAFTRSSRPVGGAPTRITDMTITRDRVVFVADGFVSVASLTGHVELAWISTGVDAPILVHAHDAGDTVVVYALTPSLERWTLRTAPATVHREVLDATPQYFAQTNEHSVDEPPRCLWTSDDSSAYKHDLVGGSRDRHSFQPGCRPGDLVFVADPSRADDPDGGWLVGFVQHDDRLATDLVVLDAADIARPAIATIRIPQRTARRLRSTWMADDQ